MPDKDRKYIDTAELVRKIVKGPCKINIHLNDITKD